MLLKAKGLLAIKTDHDGMREWLNQLVDVLDFLSEQSGIEVDDQAVDFLRSVVKSDQTYDSLYVLIEAIMNKVNPPEPEPEPEPVEPVEPVIMAALTGDDNVVTQYCVGAGIDDFGPYIEIVIQIVQIILAFIKGLKE